MYSQEYNHHQVWFKKQKQSDYPTSECSNKHIYSTPGNNNEIIPYHPKLKLQLHSRAFSKESKISE